jgi:hypothetical protein
MISLPLAPVALTGHLLDALRSAPSPDVWARFATAYDRFALGAVFFILDTRPQRDVERFMVDDMDRLLQQMQRRTERVEVVYEGQVRARVQWPATNKARLTDDYNPTRFVCREVRNQYDTPENQVVKHLVSRVTACVDAIPSIVEQGFCCYAASERRQPGRIAERLDNLQATIQRFQRNIYMRQVTLPSRITEEHLRRANASKLPEYQRALALYCAYTELCEEKSLPNLQRRILEISSAALPLPSGREDDVMALWIDLVAELLRSQIKV